MRLAEYIVCHGDIGCVGDRDVGSDDALQQIVLDPYVLMTTKRIKRIGNDRNPSAVKRERISKLKADIRNIVVFNGHRTCKPGLRKERCFRRDQNSCGSNMPNRISGNGSAIGFQNQPTRSRVLDHRIKHLETGSITVNILDQVTCVIRDGV